MEKAGCKENVEKWNNFSDAQKEQYRSLSLEVNTDEETPEQSQARFDKIIEEAIACAGGELTVLSEEISTQENAPEPDNSANESPKMNTNSSANNFLSWTSYTIPGVSVSVSNSIVTITLSDDIHSLPDNQTVAVLEGMLNETEERFNLRFGIDDFTRGNTLTYNATTGEVNSLQASDSEQEEESGGGFFQSIKNKLRGDRKDQTVEIGGDGNIQSLEIGGERDKYSYLKNTMQINNLTVRLSANVSFDYNKTLKLKNSEAPDNEILAVFKIGNGEYKELKKADFPYTIEE